jgi:hypothetical protein
MKALVLAAFLSLCVVSFAQSPDAGATYASRQILLVDPHPGIEAVLPMVTSVDGKQQIVFVPVHQVKEALDKGGRPITLADVLIALGAATERVNQLQVENDRLWKIAMKDSPKSETVVVQPLPATSSPSQADIAAEQQAQANARRQQAIQTWMLLQGMNKSQTINLNVANCTRFPSLCVGR